MASTATKKKTQRSIKQESVHKRKMAALAKKLQNDYVETATIDDIFSNFNDWKILYDQDYTSFIKLREGLRESGWAWAVSGIRYSGFNYEEDLDKPASVMRFLSTKIAALQKEDTELTLEHKNAEDDAKAQTLSNKIKAIRLEAQEFLDFYKTIAHFLEVDKVDDMEEDNEEDNEEAWERLGAIEQGILRIKSDEKWGDPEVSALRSLLRIQYDVEEELQIIQAGTSVLDERLDEVQDLIQKYAEVIRIIELNNKAALPQDDANRRKLAYVQVEKDVIIDKIFELSQEQTFNFDDDNTNYSKGYMSNFDDDDFDIYDPWEEEYGDLLSNETFSKKKSASSTPSTTTPNNNAGAVNQSWYKNCTHVHHKVTLGNGVIVHTTASRDSHGLKAQNIKPGFGLYADSGWNRICTWRNEFIAWPDMSLPSDYDLALEQIKSAYERAVNGEDIDIGCIGAHGRTGTILAIMYLLSKDGKVSATECHQFVWKNYCEHAIETKKQEWFVAYAAGYFFKTPVPEEPAAPTYTPNASKNPKVCTLTTHLAMYLRGHRMCEHKMDCKRFTIDVNDYGKNQQAWAKNAAVNKLSDYELEYGGVELTNDTNHTCQPYEHFAMLRMDHRECIWHQEECKWWEEDLAGYRKKKTQSQHESKMTLYLIEKVYPTPAEYNEAKVIEFQEDTPDTDKEVDSNA